ncbi:MAG: class I tRNA ligase family protein, partial [Leptospiraceae bacterium]|nr:class I tRNA ligase family protein [Leptospiraceae bacterium]
QELTAIDQYYLHKLAEFVETISSAYETYQFHQVYQKAIRFCTVDLSQDYFEIIRDRMYCDRRDSRTRRSSCTALSYILEALTIYLAPILSFTAEEVWKSYGKKNSVFLEKFPKLDNFKNPSLESDFQKVFEAKDVVQKALEEARRKGKIGKSIDAKVYIDGEKALELKQSFDISELELFFVVSQIEFGFSNKEVISQVSENGYLVQVLLPEEKECPRCWRHTKDVLKENQLCKRCEEAVKV